ncbi:hypothetical protein PHYBLDRAFT_174493 [Phycomyces blakesleeanus NRRL 1555(-)]|uniref:Uncharacterized protein n=1 Tax=Phycomyces blakesleeanus (strain ATCC 8743b / DSM 1359 / FGSC 10004 / NBRC 33097 / NRRL 1555) TaxID=763407 RepID=A0A167K276_PHYB8|nr:hypothetical protein PHYBLDRAFT_174493 [Phycomyces blakesleeanus NRRL 1555(-)]OAD67107.1 hypothetical protein PHYBLDRAFT_174493 [Phycomyces blakesleeanus NRRL 1555(-)]|eukprot:XP_018285147.1 hypothetical protein PHYBLDRAFT_174493 [Phycomyces blakesleeanus NRRL 1555(-)]
MEKVLKLTSSLLWWLKLKKFLRGRIEDLRLGTKIRENLCRFCLLRKDFISKFDQVPTLNYYCYLYYFGSGKLYDWGQLRPYIISFRLILNYSSSQYSFTTIINGNTYSQGYYLTDGIYLTYAAFVKSFNDPQSAKHKNFAKTQEAVRKDVECTFVVLQTHFAIVAGPARM